MNADFQSTIIHGEKFDSFSIQVQSWKKRRLQIGLKPHRRKYRVRRRGERVINSSFVAECPPGNAYKVGPNARNRNRGREKKEERRKKNSAPYLFLFSYSQRWCSPCSATQSSPEPLIRRGSLLVM